MPVLSGVEGLIGRIKELHQLREYIARRQNVLLVGPVGIGKSALLREAVVGIPSVVMVPTLQPLKPALVFLAQQLHAQGCLAIPDLDSQYLDWIELVPQLGRFSAPQLLEQLVPLLKGMILVVDEFDGISPSSARSMEPLFEAVLIVGAITTVDLTPELQRFFFHFRLMLLEPLSQEETRQLLWSQADRSEITAPETFERHVLETAGGNPLAVRELARQAHQVGMNAAGRLQEVHHEAGIHYLDLTPGLLLLGAVAIIARFLALGLKDVEGYILAGSFGALFLTSRYFLYRTLRRNS